MWIFKKDLFNSVKVVISWAGVTSFLIKIIENGREFTVLHYISIENKKSFFTLDIYNKFSTLGINYMNHQFGFLNDDFELLNLKSW